jgi:hypothetical protein
MEIQPILSDLRNELERIEQAIAALEALDGTATPKPAQPKGSASEFGANKPTGRGRGISPAGRARIAAAAKARWAKLRAAKGAKPASAKKAIPTRHVSAAARKRLSEVAKARWAKQKRQGKTTL